MADDGYLIGFEDSSGNFVEVGRFNNLSGNTSDPVFIEHTGSGTRMELDGNGFDMNGNDITGAGSVSTDNLSVTNAEVYSLVDKQSGDIDIDEAVEPSTVYKLQYVIVDGSGVNLEVTVNNDTSQIYDYRLDDGTTQTDQTSIPLYAASTTGTVTVGEFLIGGHDTGKTAALIGETTSGDTGVTSDAVERAVIGSGGLSLSSIQVSSSGPTQAGYVALLKADV